MTQESIRLQRTRAFLVTHASIVVVLGGALLLEWVLDLQADPKRAFYSALVLVILAAITMGGVTLYRLRFGVPDIIPGMILLDSIVTMFQLFQEGDFETGWIVAPAILVFMYPVFTDRPRFVWVIAGVQVALFGLFLWARAEGHVIYVLRSTDMVHDSTFAIFSWMGFSLCIGIAALLAGRASVDVLNSQRQLNAALTAQEEALRDANARIVQQQKLLSVQQLTAGVMHEINNPLTYVRTNLTSLQRDMDGLVDLLEAYGGSDPLIQDESPTDGEEIARRRDALAMETPRETISELLTDTIGGLDRVQNIIHDLRVFSRLDEAERQPTRLMEGVESTLKILGRQLSAKGVVVTLEAQEMAPLVAFPALLNQVIMNLLQNAIDAVEEGGRVQVELTQTETHQSITVSDDGPGVDAALRARIFDPFFTTKEVGQGTGLGLSLSMDIIEKHGGQLSYVDGPLPGAAFRVELPR